MFQTCFYSRILSDSDLVDADSAEWWQDNMTGTLAGQLLRTGTAEVEVVVDEQADRFACHAFVPVDTHSDMHTASY